jgi:hypothetical protein
MLSAKSIIKKPVSLDAENKNGVEGGYDGTS